MPKNVGAAIVVESKTRAVCGRRTWRVVTFTGVTTKTELIRAKELDQVIWVVLNTSGGDAEVELLNFRAVDAQGAVVTLNVHGGPKNVPAGEGVRKIKVKIPRGAAPLKYSYDILVNHHLALDPELQIEN